MNFIVENSVLIAIKQIDEFATTLVIPSGIKSIGFKACEMTKFEEIVIPNGVKEIGVNAFASCPYLKTLFIPSSCERIEEKAFFDCKALENVYIESENLTIEKDAFSVISSQTYDDLELLLTPNKPVYNAENDFPVTFHFKCNTTARNIRQIMKSAKIYSLIKGFSTENYDELLYGPHYKQYLREEQFKHRNYTIYSESFSSRCLEHKNFPEKKSRFSEMFGHYSYEANNGNNEELVISFNRSDEKTKPVLDDELYSELLHRENDKPITISTRAGKDIVPKTISRIANFGVTFHNGILIIPEGVISIKAGEYDQYAKAKRIIFPETLMIIAEGAFRFFDELESTEFKSKPLYISPKAFGDTPYYYFAKNKLSRYYDEDAYNNFGVNCSNFEKLDLNFVWGIARLFEDRMVIYTVNGISYLFDKVLKAIVLCKIDDNSKKELFIPEKIEEILVENIGAGSFSGLKELVKIEVPASVKLVDWRAFAGCTSLQNVIFHNKNGSVYLDGEIFHNCVSLQNIYFEKTPTLPLQFKGFSRWNHWNYFDWKKFYDPAHEDIDHEYCVSEMLETAMFKSPFPKIHINQLSEDDIFSMNCCMGNYTAFPVPYSPQHIEFKEISKE